MLCSIYHWAYPVNREHGEGYGINDGRNLQAEQD